MGLRVAVEGDGFLIAGGGDGSGDTDLVNRFLVHLKGRNFAGATRRAYAYDVLNFLRFLAERGLTLGQVRPPDLFEYLDWQAQPKKQTAASMVVRLSEWRGAAAATQNRRIAAVRGLFEFAVITGVVKTSPVPAARRSSGLRARRGLLGHVPVRHPRSGGRLVREHRRLPESLQVAEVEAFLTDLNTHRDRAMVLLMLLGGLRAAEVRTLRLADVDMGRRQVRVVGKGGWERVVPVDRPFFTELIAYLRVERPADCGTAECFVVLRGPTAGGALTEAGMRRIFRTHRACSGAARVRPLRLRHTYGTELAAAGIDLLVLRDLMGHASPETTGKYVHLSAATLAAEYAAAREASPW